MEDYKYTYEVCPICGNEVRLEAQMKIQECTCCKSPILPCSLCDPDNCDCWNCKLECEVMKIWKDMEKNKTEKNEKIEYSSIEYKGKKYDTIILPVDMIDSMSRKCGLNYLVTIADYELWADIAEDYDNEVDEAVNIDNSIYYYCDSGFCASKPTKEELIDYMEHTID